MGNIQTYIYTFTTQELNMCQDFAKECAKHLAEKDKTAKPVYKCDYKQVVRNCFVGKLGELAYEKFLYQHFKIDVKLDMETYIGHDDTDIKYWGKANNCTRPWFIDVKTICNGGNLARLRLKSIAARGKEEKPQHYYFFCKLFKVKDAQGSISVKTQILGYISLKKLLDLDNKKVKFLLRGDKYIVNGTTFTESTDNLCIDFADLNNDWTKLFAALDTEKPSTYRKTEIQQRLLTKLALEAKRE